MFHKCLSSLHESHANLCIVQNVVYVQPKQAQGSYLEGRRRASDQKAIRTYRERMLGKWQQQRWEETGVLDAL